MRHAALSIIHDEHRVLAAMLVTMGRLLEQGRRLGVAPDFPVLRAMLFYIDEFPERLHHTKEDELLFPRVRQRCPELGPALDQLARDHEQGEHAIREVEHALLAYEQMGEPRRQAFEQALERYTQFYLRHMALEEKQILPAAEQHFSEADWTALHEAFAANRDPFTGHEPEAAYRPLYEKILSVLPAPLGYGPAM